VRPARLRSGAGANRLLRAVCSARCDDDVVKPKGRVGRARLSLFGRLLLDIVERAPPPSRTVETRSRSTPRQSRRQDAFGYGSMLVEKSAATCWRATIASSESTFGSNLRCRCLTPCCSRSRQNLFRQHRSKSDGRSPRCPSTAPPSNSGSTQASLPPIDAASSTGNRAGIYRGPREDGLKDGPAEAMLRPLG
jgi:hypothetical protein